MKIQSIGLYRNKSKFSFKSARTDKNEVSGLKYGTRPIVENQKLNILAALDSISNDPSEDNISFLLDIAGNLVYGQDGKSQFAKAIDSDSLTPENRENINWSKVLEDTISKSLNALTSENKGDLEEEFFEVFGTEKSLTPIQEEILNLRSQLNKIIINENTLDDEETLQQTTDIRKNLDYFISSSEIPYNQRKECLEKFIYFLSDDYEITPQLQDKKLQVVDEMLNDMVIKTKDDDVLSIKDVNQRQSGICAAISICRKAVAYEDKVQYMNLVFDELSSNPEMSVYDVTDLETDKKVKIKKVDIDYDLALERGYRILDASAHNWMQNAHASGDGSIVTENYVAFEDESYGVFDDSSWFEGLDQESLTTKNFLKALIKEKELLEVIGKKRKQNQVTSKNVQVKKKQVLTELSTLSGLLNKTISDIFDIEGDNAKISEIRNSLIDFYKGEKENNEANIAPQMPTDLKKMLLEEFIISTYSKEMNDSQLEKLKNKSSKLLVYTSEYVAYDKHLKKLNSMNSASETYRMNKRLFKAAAAHRLAIEEDINLPDAIIRYERVLGIPPKDKRGSNYIQSLISSFSNEKVREKYKREDGTIPTQEELEIEAISDIAKLDVIFPYELNTIVEALLDQNLVQTLNQLFDNIKNAVNSGDKETLARYSSTLDLKNDKTALFKFLDRYQSKLDENATSEDVQEAIRALCFEDRIMVGDLVVGSFFQTLQKGISEEMYETLKEKFGEDNLISGLQSMQDRYAKMRYEHEQIFEKWNIPTSREVILSKLEKKQDVLPRKKLDVLNARFKEIQKQLNKNDSIKNSKERRKANEEAYKFTKEEQEIFDLIEKSYSSMKKYNKISYQNLNTQMKNALEEQYSYIGMLNGQFWVREEGSTGLVGNEQVRILEQMTGKPYHLEYDVNDAVKQIKEGKGSGILSSSVDDKDYAFHAQYIPAVTTETFTNPVTGKTHKEDILWTDNSWGKSEKDHFWNGRNGFNYTDYGSRYGWKNGFILDDSFKIGLPVKDIHCAVGHSKEDKEDFSLFTDVVLEGSPVSAYQKLVKMFSYIFQMGEGERYFNMLEKQIEEGARINPEYLLKLDQFAEAKADRIEKRINDKIKTKADFDKLPETDELKFSFNKIALHCAADNPELKEIVSDAETVEQLAQAKQEIIDAHVHMFAHIIGKSQDTIDEIQASMNAPLRTLMKEIKDNYGIVKSDEEQSKILTSIFPSEDEFMELSGSLKDLEAFILNKIPHVAVENFESKDVAVKFIETMQAEISDYIKNEVRINSLSDKSFKSKPFDAEFINAVDKYLKPKDNNELLTLLQQMQDSTFETVKPFFDSLTEEDLGINIKPAYDYLHQFKMYNSNVRRVFQEIIGAEEISKRMNCSEELSTVSTPDEFFRALYIKIADLDVQKFIKGYKNEAFEKYKVRQAFPAPVVLPDSTIIEAAETMMKEITSKIDSISGTSRVVSIFEVINTLNSRYFDTEIFNDLRKGKTISVQENQEFLTALFEDFAKLESLVCEDSSLSVLSEPLSQMLHLIQKADSELGGRKFAFKLNSIMSILDSWEETGVNLDKFLQQKKDELADLNNAIKMIVNANIEPKYRNQGIELLKKFVSTYREAAYNYEIDDVLNEFKGFIVERHITKNPVELLKECVNLMQSGKKDSGEYEVLKKYLLDTLKVAQQTKIQYQLVQNQHEGISSKTRDMLPMFGITLTDGSWAKMDSEQGFLYLIHQLQNASDNHTTLNLFLSQSGLAKDALKAVIENIEIDKSKEIVDEKVDLVNKYLDDVTALLELNDEFVSKNARKFKSMQGAIDSLAEFLEEKSKEHTDSPIFYNFVNFLRAIELNDALNAVKGSLIKELLCSFLDQGADVLSTQINSQIDYLEELNDLIRTRYELVNIIKIPDDCEEVALRDDFNKKFAVWQNYVTDTLNALSEKITTNNLDRA